MPNAVVTDGPNGAFVRFGGSEHHVAGVPVRADRPDRRRRHVRRVVPLRHHARRPAEKAARAANFLAMKVITQIGARLHPGAKDSGRSSVSGG